MIVPYLCGTTQLPCRTDVARQNYRAILMWHGLVQFMCDLLSVFTFSIVISVALSFIYDLLSIDLIYMFY